MEDKPLTTFVIGVLAGVVLAMITVAGPIAAGKIELKQQAVERHFAEYNSTNGVWQWREK